MSSSTLPKQSGRTWLITGGTHGIGTEVARAAAAADARVLITARNPELGEQVRAEVGAARVIDLDLASMDSVRRAAESVDEPIDVLINNAGTMPLSHQETEDGFELTLGVNFLGPFALTNLLMDQVRERVVCVSSIAYKRGKIDWQDPHFRHGWWSSDVAYAQSKLAVMLWGFELQRRLNESDRKVTLVHPGWVVTNMQNVTRSRLLNRLNARISGAIGQSAEDGARPVLVAATSDLPGAAYVTVSGRGGFRGRPMVTDPGFRAQNPAASRRVWKFAAAETGTNLACRTS